VSGCPSHLVFDEEPSPEQLAVLLGPDVPAVRAVIREDDERVTVTQQRVPVVGVAIFWFAQRAAQQQGPGAVVDKRTGALSLPWIDAVVPPDRLVRFVHLRARRRAGAHVQPVGQHAALFRDEDGRHVYAPFVRLITRRLGRTPSQRLADLFDVPVQKVDAGLL